MSNIMSEQSKEESRGINMIDTGAPHFKSVARMHRSSNYTFLKVVCELLDNVLRKATEVKGKISSGRILGIRKGVFEEIFNRD